MRDMTAQHIITKARTVTADKVLLGTMAVRDGTILDLRPGRDSRGRAEDWHGDYLMPGHAEHRVHRAGSPDGQACPRISAERTQRPRQLFRPLSRQRDALDSAHSAAVESPGLPVAAGLICRLRTGHRAFSAGSVIPVARSLLSGLIVCAGLLAPWAAQAQGTLTIGLVPAEDPRLMVADNQAIIEALRASLGTQIKPFVATDYNGVIEALRAKKLDLALLGPFSYVLAASVAGIEPIAVPETQKQGASYHSLIIARTERNIRSLADLKGKTFAFVDPSSASGHLFPKTAMIRAGLDPDTDLRAIFAGSHDASAIAVQNGKVDAAAVADGLLEAAMARGVVKGDEIRIVWTSDPIPGAPAVMRSDLPDPLKQRIRAAFAAMRDVPWSKGTIIKRWVPASDANFAVVREAAKVLNLDLRRMK